MTISAQSKAVSSARSTANTQYAFGQPTRNVTDNEHYRSVL